MGQLVLIGVSISLYIIVVVAFKICCLVGEICIGFKKELIKSSTIDVSFCPNGVGVVDGEGIDSLVRSGNTE